MINIFQFLKQGTSLSRHSHNSNQQLEQHIIPHQRQKNHTYQETGKFHDTDSELEEEPEVFDEDEVQQSRKKQLQKVHELNKKYRIKVGGLDCPESLSNFTKLIQ
jgi:3-deoxy-D-arabino-heptulosonate 7-phosphate (DAHP) synthase class II